MLTMAYQRKLEKNKNEYWEKVSATEEAIIILIIKMSHMN